MYTEICTAITTVCSIILTRQIYLLKKQIKEDHDRSRRENTVTALTTWTNSIRRETSVAESIVEKFTPEQCRLLYARKPFTISKDLMLMVKEICPNDKLVEEDLLRKVK